MKVRLYADECANGHVIRALRARGVDLLTVWEDGLDRQPDPVVMDRATELGRVLFSQDDDLLAEATRRQRAGIPFSGLIFAHQSVVTIGVCIGEIELIVNASEAEEYRDRVQYLPI